MKKIYIITLLFLNLIGYSQPFNFSENFESGIPSSWATFETGTGTKVSWGVNDLTLTPTYKCGGNYAAFLNRENVASGQAIDWLVTPKIIMPSNGELRFMTKQTLVPNYGSLYSVRVSTTSQTNPAAFTEVVSWSESNLNSVYNVCEEKVVDLSAYPAGTELYIAFVMQNDNGDRWIVDDINLAKKCESVISYVHTWNINSTTALLTWNSPSGIDHFDVQVAPFSDNYGGGSTMDYPNVTNPLTLYGLNPNILYKFRVRSRCTSPFTSDWFGSAMFKTSIPANCPNDFYFVSNNNVISNVYWRYSPDISNPTLFINGVSVDLSNPIIADAYYYSKYINYANPTTNNLSLVFKKNSTATPYQTFLPYQNYSNITLDNEFCKNDFVTITQPPFSSSQSLPNTAITWKIEELGVANSATIINISNPVQLTQSGIFSIFETININTSNEEDEECHTITNSKLVVVKNCASCANQNPSLNHIKSKLIALLNYLKNNASTITSGYTCDALSQLSPFITTTNPAIYNFVFSGDFMSFSFSSGTTTPDISFLFQGDQITNLYVIEYNSSTENEFTFEFDGNDQILLIKRYILNKIDFCKQSCTLSNSNSQVINGLFVKLIKKIVAKKNAGVSDATINAEASTYPEFINLAPYITDPNPTFTNLYSDYTITNSLRGISFAFSNSHHGYDVNIEGTNFNSILNSSNFLFDISSYFDSEYPMMYTDWMSDNILVKSTYIRHINFCSQVPFCAKHIAIVMDESGSLRKDDYDTLRLQLRNFINAQADGNLNSGTNTKVSIIGLSDSDTDGRTSTGSTQTALNGYHVIATDRLLPSNITPYLQWISTYGKRSNTSVSDAISKNSDYWASGLQKALAIQANQVILITDGCQSGNVSGLKNILSNFTNHNIITSEYKPHLYILGKKNGYYVDQLFTTNRFSNFNPNDIIEDDNDVAQEAKELDFVENNEIELNVEEELAKEAKDNAEISNVTSATINDENSRTASSLLLSLKYLYNLNLTSDVLNFKYDFNKDCFATQDFLFLIDPKESNYLYNNLIESRYTCSKKIPVEVCDDCVGFRPNPGEPYIISAWVKQERKDQVINYKASPVGAFLGIKLKFYKINEDGSINESYTDSYLTTINCEIVQGEMIEGWQRIFKQFKMPKPSYPYVIRIELQNEDNAKPAFFDDIRIHPVDSNLKSFVYDAETNKLMVELDENNFGTFYEYDKEGGLIRVKKETSKGIKTIQETRQSNTLRN